MTQVKGRYFSSSTTAVVNEDGDWEVTCDMVERRLLEGSPEWEEKVIATKSTADSFEKAYGISMNATLEKFATEVDRTKSDSLFGKENEYLPEDTGIVQ
jgi:hypothetical protein